jgi:hypothetical protein
MIETAGKAEPLWERNLSFPAVLYEGTLLRQSAPLAEFVEGGRILVTNGGFTYCPAPEGVPLREPPPVEHPYINCLFLYDLDGTLLSRYRFEGYYNRQCAATVSGDGKYVIVPQRQTYIPDNLLGIVPMTTETHGVLVFNIDQEGCFTEKLDWFYHTEGPIADVGITSDGKYVVAVEVPVDMNPDPKVTEIVGSYRVHFLN